MLHRDRRRAESFGEDPEQYDRARPGYPPELVRTVLDQLADGTGTVRVLDVGCGTGIAGRLFAAQGADVLGVEPDARMAAVARSHGLAVEDGSFETWADDGRRFDAVVSGQAWHWIDPEVGAGRAAEVLRPGGVIAVFWNHGLLPAELSARLRDVYARRAPGLERYSVLLGNSIDDRVAVTRDHLELHPAFSHVDVCTFHHEVGYTTAAWTEHLVTHSDHRVLEPALRAPLLAAVEAEIEAVGGSFTMRYETRCVLGRRR